MNLNFTMGSVLTPSFGAPIAGAAWQYQGFYTAGNYLVTPNATNAVGYYTPTGVFATANGGDIPFTGPGPAPQWGSQQQTGAATTICSYPFLNEDMTISGATTSNNSAKTLQEYSVFTANTVLNTYSSAEPDVAGAIGMLTGNGVVEFNTSFAASVISSYILVNGSLYDSTPNNGANEIYCVGLGGTNAFIDDQNTGSWSYGTLSATASPGEVVNFNGATISTVISVYKNFVTVVGTDGAWYVLDMNALIAYPVTIPSPLYGVAAFNQSQMLGFDLSQNIYVNMQGTPPLPAAVYPYDLIVPLPGACIPLCDGLTFAPTKLIEFKGG
jgi:hypothetical protein